MALHSYGVEALFQLSHDAVSGHFRVPDDPLPIVGHFYGSFSASKPRVGRRQSSGAIPAL